MYFVIIDSFCLYYEMFNNIFLLSYYKQSMILEGLLFYNKNFMNDVSKTPLRDLADISDGSYL